MRAAVMQGIGQPLKAQQIALPDPG